jgi:NAD(P)-dependent dehydrogenase (short-subunit alcohol dehydrogenase family)
VGAPFAWRTDATYLITGGLGDLGLSVARWMVEQGARRLILMGRAAMPPRTQWRDADEDGPLGRRLAAILELEALGASVHLASVDVADERQLRGFLSDFHAEGWPPIRGVVHAAGVLHDGLLMQLDAEALDRVLRPKMLGGWLLDRLLDPAVLDFFVLFSSAGSLLGQPGQGNYAAANAFLDALAHQRRARGRHALSINWGAWTDLGFANTAGGKRLASHLALQGVRALAPSEALSVLGRLLGQGSTQIAAVPVDWERYRQFHPAGTTLPLLSELTAGISDAAPVELAGETRAALLRADPEERRRLLQAYLSERVGLVLGTPADAVDVQQPLSNLGLDSLMAVELKNRIAIDLGVSLPMVTLLSGPSIDQAVATLLELLVCGASPSMESTPTALSPPPSRDSLDGVDDSSLAALSDDDVTSLLTEMLAKQDARE